MSTYGIEVIEWRERYDRYEFDIKIFDKSINDVTKTDIYTGTISLLPKPLDADLVTSLKAEILTRIKSTVSIKRALPAKTKFDYDFTLESITEV